MLLHNCEYSNKMLNMFLNTSIVSEYIAKKDQHILLEVGLKDMIHQALKDSWCIGKAKGHN